MRSVRVHVGPEYAIWAYARERGPVEIVKVANAIGRSVAFVRRVVDDCHNLDINVALGCNGGLIELPPNEHLVEALDWTT